MTTITIDEETIAAIDRAADAMAQANDGLRGLNMGEGEDLAGMFAALGREKTARRILMTVWYHEEEDCRDPMPMLDEQGVRHAVQDDCGWPGSDEAKLERSFQPRPNGQWEVEA